MNPILEICEKKGTLLGVPLEITPRVYEFGEVSARRDELKRRLSSIIGQVGRFVAVFEVGLPLILALDPLNVTELIENTKSEYNTLFLARCRVVDFDHSNRVLASHLFELGFDAIITQVFTGYSGSIDGILEEAKARGKYVIGTVMLGNPGASKLFNVHYKEMIALCNRLKLDGVEVAASALEAVRSVRKLTPRSIALICSSVPPNKIAARGAFLAGADLVILGRGILSLPSPASALSEMLRELKELRR